MRDDARDDVKVDPTALMLADDGFEAEMILDSINENGERLCTVRLRYPRFIHSEVLTHRDRARNSASSRAIPWPKMLAMIEQEPVVPIAFGAEQRGMQTGSALEGDELEEARRVWLSARDAAAHHAQLLADLGVHKSICNRLTEPWMWITVVMTATEWKNFFRLRCHPDAEIHFQRIACIARELLDASTPRLVRAGEWHLPFVTGYDEEELRESFIPRVLSQDKMSLAGQWLAMISTARCARVSYLTHDAQHDPFKDLELYGKLVRGSGFGHWSPMEHPATPLDAGERSGPFRGWMQYRKCFANECAD